MTLTTQLGYRLARGLNTVPDAAPRHLRWHHLDTALRDVAAWAEAQLKAGELFGGVSGVNDEPWNRRKTYEIRPLTWEIKTEACQTQPGDENRVVGLVIVKVYVERRFYETHRAPLSAVVNGVTLQGYGPEERVYTSEWTTAWLRKPSWCEGDRAYATARIPVASFGLDWADDPDPLVAAERMVDLYEKYGRAGIGVTEWAALRTAIARAVGKLPGAPTPVVPSALLVRDRVTYFRDDEGIRWVDVAEPGPDYEFVLDLDDAATGGVLLAHLGPGWLIYQRDHDRQWEIARPDGADKQEGPTLAIALARLIIARGGWNV